MLDKLVNGIDCGIRAISEVFAGPVYGYCRLETVDDDVLVADDGSLVSLLRLEGSLKHVGVEEYGSIVSGLTEKFQSSFSKPGHLLQVVFEYDPESSASRITELLRPSRLTAQNLGLHVGRCWMTGEPRCNATALWKPAGSFFGQGPPFCRIPCGKQP